MQIKYLSHFAKWFGHPIPAVFYNNVYTLYKLTYCDINIILQKNVFDSAI